MYNTYNIFVEKYAKSISAWRGKQLYIISIR